MTNWDDGMYPVVATTDDNGEMSEYRITRDKNGEHGDNEPIVKIG